MKPLLLRIARPQRIIQGPATKYSDDLDELLVLEGDGWVPALDSDQKPETKKADLEKGEDMKDRWRP
jgi:hypothetical protein